MSLGLLVPQGEVEGPWNLEGLPHVLESCCAHGFAGTLGQFRVFHPHKTLQSTEHCLHFTDENAGTHMPKATSSSTLNADSASAQLCAPFLLAVCPSGVALTDRQGGLSAPATLHYAPFS